MTDTPFDQVITEHLTLAERNKRLEPTMPLDRYREPGAGNVADAPLSHQAEAPAGVCDAAQRWTRPSASVAKCRR
jgi:hypothetical protein